MKTFNPITISCFKAYDVRGELDVNLDSVIVYRIGRAFTQYLNYGQKIMVKKTLSSWLVQTFAHPVTV